MKWDEKYLQRGDKNIEIRKKIQLVCPICRNIFQKTNKGSQRYCSPKCANTANRKVKNRPLKEKLLKELKNANFEEMGRKYGVTGNCIRKWLKISNEDIAQPG